MTTLTLYPDPAVGRMRIVVEGAAGGTLMRDETVVRGGVDLAGDLVVDDYECPFGVDVRYWVAGVPDTSVDEPVDVGPQPIVPGSWSTSWNGWGVSWDAAGATVERRPADTSDALLRWAGYRLVTPGERYRFAAYLVGLAGSARWQHEVLVATDESPNFFDAQTVATRSGITVVTLGATTVASWELTVPTTIVPDAGAGAPRSLGYALRGQTATAEPGTRARVERVEITRVGVLAGSVVGRLDSDTPWLTHPTRPELNRPVELVDDPELSWETPGTAHTVIGSSPPVWTHSARTLHSGTVELVDAWPDRHGMTDLLLDGSALLLRVPPGCLVDGGWIAVQRARRRKLRADYPNLRWALEYQRVAAPGGLTMTDPSNAWDGLVASHASWSAVLSDHASWADVLLTPHPHTSSPT